jgi:tRNA (guanine26-N2/guanine27-N2)-dimethyltransferase
MKYNTIKEGSITMVYPADQESSVFYNPVQVQNRDLSVLMISLYAERRCQRLCLANYKNQIRKQYPKEQHAQLLDDFTKKFNPTEYIARESHTDSTVKSAPANDVPQQIKGLYILDALAASGLRSMRYWKEIPGIHHITINDLDPAAVERAHATLVHNNLESFRTDSSDSYGIRIQQGDALDELYQSRRCVHTSSTSPPTMGFYDVIDLDPYGSAAPFLDGAVQAIRHGGMLNLTCTDMVALAGSHPETCYGRYGSLPLQRVGYVQEAALRILLQLVARTAAKYGRSIRPILSVGMDFYIRCFVEVYDDKAGILDLSLQIGSVYQSVQCPSFVVVPHGQHSRQNQNIYQSTRAPSQCEETGAPYKVGGPIWLGPLHCQTVVAEALKRLDPKNQNLALATRQRLEGLLLNVQDELTNAPLYYLLPELCHTLHCSTPPIRKFKAAIVNAGYQVSGYHKNPQAIKTNAPNRIVWDILRAWCKIHPPVANSKQKKKGKRKLDSQSLEGTPSPQDDAGSVAPLASDNDKPVITKSAAEMILAVEPSIKVNFSTLKIEQSSSRSSKVPRFPMNPEKNWGPKKAASGILPSNNPNKRKYEDTEQPFKHNQDTLKSNGMEESGTIEATQKVESTTPSTSSSSSSSS